MRKVFVVSFFGGPFNEYADISIYAFELAMVVYLAIYILENKISILSIYRKHMFHVEQIAIISLLSFLSTFYFIIREGHPLQVFIVAKIFFYTLFFIAFYFEGKNYVPRGTYNFLECSTWNTYFPKMLKKSKYVPPSPKDSFWRGGTIYTKIHPKVYQCMFHVEQFIEKYTKLCSTWNIIKLVLFFSLLFQGIIAFLQVLRQESLGLTFLGESVLNTHINGVATVIINGEEFLRGYGTFLHPNLLAAFVLINILVYYLLFIVPRGTPEVSHQCSTWNISAAEEPKIKYVPRGTIMYNHLIEKIYFILGFFVILVSFSKIVIALSLIFLCKKGILFNCSTWNNDKKTILEKIQNVPRGTKISKICSTWNKSFQKALSTAPNVPRGTPIFRVICSTWNIQKSQALFFTAFLLFLIAFIIGKEISWETYLYQSILERKIQYLSIEFIPWINILTGLGYGGYVAFIANLGVYELWELQPIHNVLVMAVLEIGILPLGVIFLLLASYIPKNLAQFYARAKKSKVFYVALLLVPLFLLDHYFWDLEQGVFLLGTLVVIMILAYKRSLYTKKLL
jgi:hypothetical protein